ncbi:MAG TPA: hypothetical protein VMV34_05485 [Terriglobia bacterium]|nr:hypothetical protein [Terriglobia bacterium]
MKKTPADKPLSSARHRITPHRVGYLIRRKLGLKTEKHHGHFVIAVSEGPKLARLFEKYGISSVQGDLGDSGDSVEEDSKGTDV